MCVFLFVMMTVMSPAEPGTANKGPLLQCIEIQIQLMIVLIWPVVVWRLITDIVLAVEMLDRTWMTQKQSRNASDSQVCVHLCLFKVMLRKTLSVR